MTGQKPQAMWRNSGFLPHMPDSLEQLDLLLVTVPRTRLVRQEGIRLHNLWYVDLNLSAYIGEEVVIRYDPRDLAEIRVYHNHTFVGKCKSWNENPLKATCNRSSDVRWSSDAADGTADLPHRGRKERCSAPGCEYDRN